MTDQLRLQDSNVMGRLAVMVTSTGVMVAAVGQFVDGLGSKVLNDVGGYDLDVVWSLAGILAWVFVWAARFWKNPQEAAVLEVGGIVLISVVAGIYSGAVISQPGGIEGRLFVLLVCITLVINCLGRAILLMRRFRMVERVSKNG